MLFHYARYVVICCSVKCSVVVQSCRLYRDQRPSGKIRQVPEWREEGPRSSTTKARCRSFAKVW